MKILVALRQQGVHWEGGRCITKCFLKTRQSGRCRWGEAYLLDAIHVGGEWIFIERLRMRLSVSDKVF